jgi:hypothetical protein
MPILWKSPDPRIRFWQEGEAAHLDVRELLLAGGRPYASIMECVGRMQAGDVLFVHAVIEPKPLVAQLRQRGLACTVRQEGPEHWVLEARR